MPDDLNEVIEMVRELSLELHELMASGEIRDPEVVKAVQQMDDVINHV